MLPLLDPLLLGDSCLPLPFHPGLAELLLQLQFYPLPVQSLLVVLHLDLMLRRLESLQLLLQLEDLLVLLV